jgi:hypothetical protein
VTDNVDKLLVLIALVDNKNDDLLVSFCSLKLTLPEDLSRSRLTDF